MMQLTQLACLAAVLAAVLSAPAALAQAGNQTAPPAAGGQAEQPVEQTQKLKLGVFMESLCPDSRRFFLNQLAPTELVLGQVLELNLVPFGHARTLGNNRMICQHGARECEGNRRMACLRARAAGNQTQLVRAFECIFRLDDDAKTCVAKHMGQVDWAELEACTSGAESYALMVSAEKETGKLSYVPHFTLNGQSSDDIQDGAEHRLREFLCRNYKGTAPLDACKDYKQGAGSQAPTTSSSGDSTTFSK